MMEKSNFLNKLFNVENKIVLVTGGGSGIGKMISEVLALSGSKVYITSRKSDMLERTASTINLKMPKYKVQCICSDLSSEGGIKNLIEKFEDRMRSKLLRIKRFGLEDASNALGAVAPW